MKLRGRETVAAQSRGRTISPRARGDITARDGTLQRLLGGRASFIEPSVFQSIA